MQIETRQVGGVLRLDDNTRIVIHRRQGERVVLGATAPAGAPLAFDGAYISPMSGTAGASTFLFSLLAVRRFVLGRYEVQVWLPGDLVPLAAGCDDTLHFGITILPDRSLTAVSNRSQYMRPLPAPVVPARPQPQIGRDGGWPLFGGA